MRRKTQSFTNFNLIIGKNLLLLYMKIWQTIEFQMQKNCIKEVDLILLETFLNLF
jgi:hypothetical protein